MAAMTREGNKCSAQDAYNFWWTSLAHLPFGAIGGVAWMKHVL
jgi:hypothetical protein